MIRAYFVVFAAVAMAAVGAFAPGLSEGMRIDLGIMAFVLTVQAALYAVNHRVDELGDAVEALKNE